MDGTFSLSATGCRVETTLLEQVSPRLDRRAASAGCISLVTFFVQAKKVTRPVRSGLVRSFIIKTGEMLPQTLAMPSSQLVPPSGHFDEPSVVCFARSNAFTSCK
jgi:hypothetical protein